MKIIFVYQNTKENEEDIALTPYLFGVWLNKEQYKAYGIGFCWFYSALGIMIATNLPKGFPRFRKISNKAE